MCSIYFILSHTLLTLFQHADCDLVTACQYHNVEIAKRLVALGADIRLVSQYPDSTILKSMIALTWYATSLHKACYENDRDALKGLLNSGTVDTSFDINARNVRGWTALHVAAYLNRLEELKLLLVAGADAYLVTEMGHTALHLACVRGHFDIIVSLTSKQKF